MGDPEGIPQGAIACHEQLAHKAFRRLGIPTFRIIGIGIGIGAHS